MKAIYLLAAVLLLSLSLLAQQDQPSTTPINPVAANPAANVVDSNTPPAAAEATTATPRTPIALDSARLHVYRQRRYIGSALSPTITVDGTKVARVGNGRRVIIKLAPGPHTIGSDDKSSAISIEAKAGQDYYIRVDEEAGFWKGHGRLTMLMPEQGSAEFKLQKAVEPDRKFAKAMIEEDLEAVPEMSK